MVKHFVKKPESFRCHHCRALVVGSGYTNHCPRCLWSRHVDINPGDRRADCHGLMEPIGLKIKHGRAVLSHRCQRCGLIKTNRQAPDDDRAKLVELSAV